MRGCHIWSYELVQEKLVSHIVARSVWGECVLSLESEPICSSKTEDSARIEVTVELFDTLIGQDDKNLKRNCLNRSTLYFVMGKQIEGSARIIKIFFLYE